MAGVSIEGKRGGRRALDSDINMIPMIDLLMVTISFLLITAVWVQSSRLEATASVPGSAVSPPCEGECHEDPKLHVETADPAKFLLVWKQGKTVVRSAEVERVARSGGSRGRVAYPDLATRIAQEWTAAGAHKNASDRRFDRAVVHAPNDMPYAELIAVMDAVAYVKRPAPGDARDARGTRTSQTGAFEVTFATD